jgi:hypothetical protein
MRLGRKSSSDSTAAASGKKECKPGQEFIFRASGREVSRAKNADEFVRMVKTIPLESVVHHANHNDFASWLRLIGENEAAEKIGKIRGNGEDVRRQILGCF